MKNISGPAAGITMAIMVSDRHGDTEISILISNDIIRYVTSTAVKNLGLKNGKQQTYRSIIAKYGQNKGLTIYSHIKKHI